jgi:hypothetical protein
MVLNKNYISLGFQCTVVDVFKMLDVKKETLPFDWMLSNPKFVYKILHLLIEKNMDIEELVKEHFFNCDSFAKYESAENFIEMVHGPDFYNKKYNVIFPHDKDYDNDVLKYMRRFNRLKALILDKSNELIFVYITPSSNLEGNFTINKNVVITDTSKYINKIYELIDNISENFKIVVLDTMDIQKEEKLNKNIYYESITPKSYFVSLKDDCYQKLINI